MHNPEVGDIYIGIVNDGVWEKGKLYRVRNFGNDIVSLNSLVGTFPDNRTRHSIFVKSLNPHSSHNGSPVVKLWNG